MTDFISGFFSWGKSKKVEEPKEKEVIQEKPKEDVHTFNNKSLRGSNKDIIGEEQE